MMRLMDKLFERPLLALLVLALLIGFSVLPDIIGGPPQPMGTDYVGLVREFDGKTYYCNQVTNTNHCSEWEDVADSATDVADAFGPGMLGVAKGEAPLLPTDLWYSAFLNPINTTVFSLSMETGIPVFAILLGSVLLFWFLTLRALKPKSVGVVLAVTVLPGYVAFMSAATLSGGMALVTIVHLCGVPLLLLIVVLKLFAGINISTGSRRSADGEFETYTVIGKGGGLRRK
ncbi:MAG: hypothetical protein BroJett025_11230 [Patescibacteria group bacterium]|nr:MAG: hypothetical protein BroJett025_11230 [Patescibacteria group bacterium]